MPLSLLIVEQRGRLSFMIESDQRAMKIALPVNRLGESDVRRTAGEALIIGGLIKSPVEPGRSDFKNVLMPDHILDIEKEPDPVADGRAVICRDAAGLIDIDAEELRSTARHLDVD